MSRSAFRVRGCHPLWPCFPACSAMLRFSYCRRSYNPGRCQRQPRFGLLRVRSPLLAQSLLLSLPPGTKMFQFPGFALELGSSVGIAPDGFPHSDIRGSTGICPSPRLFAAYHVLHRLREPQASPMRPCSLSCFRTAHRPRAGSPVFDLARIFFRTGNHPTGQSPLSYQSFSLRSITLKLLQSSCVPNMSMSVSLFSWRITDSNR